MSMDAKWERYGYIGHSGLPMVREAISEDCVGRKTYREIAKFETPEDAQRAVHCHNAMLGVIEPEKTMRDVREFLAWLSSQDELGYQGRHWRDGNAVHRARLLYHSFREPNP